MFGDYTYKNPEMFYLMLVLLPMAIWYILRYKKNSASIRISSTSALSGAPLTSRHILRHLPFVLQLGAMALFITEWCGVEKA